MSRPLVVANWKMHGDLTLVNKLIPDFADLSQDCEVVICPPHTLLASAKIAMSQTRLKLGAQNVSWYESGAYTGEVSVSMLREQGCEYVIVGHSERRGHFAETEDQSAKKFKACVGAGLVPIFCVGETRQQRLDGETEAAIAGQLQAIFNQTDIAALSGSVLAYEPVWAIGTGDTATPAEAAEVHRYIRQLVAEQDVNISKNIQILYGGSVNEENAARLFAEQGIDGALVGGASLKAEAFKKICCAAAAM